MTTRTRIAVVLISAPVLAFAVVGSLLGRTSARQETYPHLRVFDDVFSLTTGNYVEPVDVDKLMHGAMHGLADSLDADSAFLTADEVKAVESGAPLPAGDVGVDLTRQYYLRIIAVRDGSPAARAGLRSGDFVRLIDRQPTREMSVWEGIRKLRGTPGTPVSVTIIRGNAADPHVVSLTREAMTPAPLTSKMAGHGVGVIRIAEFTDQTPSALRTSIVQLQKSGAKALVLDLRNTARGPLLSGIATARLFVASGTLAMQDTRGTSRQTMVAATGDGSLAVPLALLVDIGTTGAAELFASALAGQKRAELFGERTGGRAAQQRLFALPDGSALWMSYAWYLTPAGNPIHERGLQPDVAIEQPDIEFGAEPPAADATLDKAVERLGSRLSS
ncbi:MAG: S41 family peptidase [Acidobacteria bacterium]|nr:S41 family peptidase [Acidobacteriota bacterium]